MLLSHYFFIWLLLQVLFYMISPKGTHIFLLFFPLGDLRHRVMIGVSWGALTMGWNLYFPSPETPKLENLQLLVGSQVRGRVGELSKIIF